MEPEAPNDRQHRAPLIPQRAVLHTSQVPSRDERAQVAAAHVAREQVNAAYGSHTGTSAPALPEETKADDTPLEDENPYERSHSANATIEANHWKHYHSAWQDYYQKYYERYYLGQLYKTRQTLETRAQEAAQATPKQEEKPAVIASRPAPETLSRDEALYELRSTLLGRMRTSAAKVRRSRHFVPITAALCVVVLFLFLQYNRVLFANVQAYISPGDIDPANIIVDPTVVVAVDPAPKLIIPKINVDVPVIYDTTTDYDSQMKAMEQGVAWFGFPGANSKPGQIGNTVLSGHSSNDVIDPGAYKFIFARLDQLNNGDMIYINYESKRYSYTVTKKEVVKPTDVQKLVYATDKPVLTLITCTPLGTSLNRLLVTAEQVSPNPKAAAAAPSTSGSDTNSAMPGNSPTFVERLFGNN